MADAMRVNLLGRLRHEGVPMEPNALHQLVTDLASGHVSTALPAAPPQWRLHAQSAHSAVTPRESRQTRNVAVVPIMGPILPREAEAQWFGGTSAEWLTRAFLELTANPTVHAVVLNVDSPGGVVTGVPEAAAALRALSAKKPTVAVSNGMMASAAYWIASGARTIVSAPSSQTGSIGVWMAHVDMSRALDAAGLTVSVISAGKHKVDGNPYQPLTDDARAALQANVSATYDWFVRDVAIGRGVTPAAVRAGYGQGRALVGADAVAAKLVDRIGSLDSTIARVLNPGATTGQYAGMVADLAERGIPAPRRPLTGRDVQRILDRMGT
jgi:capsid assembly protease